MALGKENCAAASEGTRNATMHLSHALAKDEVRAPGPSAA
jgi:hypothetical protein